MVVHVISAILIGISAVGIVYLMAATVAVRRFLAVRPEERRDGPAVTILKPLCGLEPELGENLRSFAKLGYPQYQVIYGIRSATDDSIPVVEKLIKEEPATDQQLIVNGQTRGRNLKVSSLRNMLPSAKHDILVISDSDIRVRPDYLSEVVRPLSDPEVGIVTCLYRARPADNIWSFFGALGINHGFLPSVVFSRAIGIDQGCFGATMALKRSTLEEIGGFDAIKDLLSDDYSLGEAVRGAGKKVVISRHIVDLMETSSTFFDLFLQEVRWGRTVRSVVPAGYIASIVTNPTPFAFAAAAISGFAWPALTALLAAIATRVWMSRTIDRHMDNRPAPLWMLPVRDLLTLIVYVASLYGTEVVWRDRRLSVRSGGHLTAAVGSDT